MVKRLLILIVFCIGLVRGVFAGASDTVRVQVDACDSVVWFGIALYHDTVAEHFEMGEEDTTLYILHLTIHNSIHVDLYDAACLSYSWHDTVFTETGDYSYIYTAANGCDSVETLHLNIITPPEMYAISGDTVVCRNQYVVFSYPNDDLEHYSYSWDMFPSGSAGINVPSIEWFTGNSDPGFVTVGMTVVDLQHQCSYDTVLIVRVCDEISPEPVQVLRKSNSNMLICSESQDQEVHYRWGLTDKNSMEEMSYDWDYNYFQYDMPIDTTLYRYWVEVYTVHGDVICHNRSFFETSVITDIDLYDLFHVIAHLQNDRLLVNIDNPGQSQVKGILYDMSGRSLAQWDFGTEQNVHRQVSFSYPSGMYILSFMAGNQCYTTKIVCQK